MGFIEDQIVEAERRIKDSFFEPAYTVSVADLKGGNEMICLDRVWKMSKQLSKKLVSQ